ncbi:MAG: hypothetical protein ABFS02_10565 [Pseudomonadota bacterium]
MKAPTSNRTPALVGREKETETFKRLVGRLTSAEDAHVWPIDGPGGIGKTALLERLRQLSSPKTKTALLTDWDLLRRERFCAEGEIDSVNLWLNVLLRSDNKAMYSRGERPRRFGAVARTVSKQPLYKALEPFAPAMDATEKAVDLPAGARLWSAVAFTVLKGLHGVWKRAIRTNPERALLDAVAKALSNRPLIWFIDNHDLAGPIQVTTRLRFSGPRPYWLESPGLVCFTDYLGLVCRYLGRHGPCLLVVTGRYPLGHLAVEDLTLQWEPPAHLQTLSVHQIRTMLKRTLTDENGAGAGDRELDDLGGRIGRLTEGNPILVAHCTQLLRKLQPDGKRSMLDAWAQEVEAPFALDEKIGFHGFVAQRLAARVGGDGRIRDRLWRISIPYRLHRDDALEQILFPCAEQVDQSSLLERLAEVGLLHTDRTYPKRLFRHRLDYAVLSRLSDECPAERDELHSSLQQYFAQREDAEASAYHRLCGEDRTVLTDAGMEPEEYWQRVSSRIDLTEKERRHWRFDPLPAERTLKTRIRRLRRDDDLLEELCGDAAGFLQAKLRAGSLELRDLDDAAKIGALLDEAGTLSDLHYLEARCLFEREPTEALAILERITERINPTHAWAWYRRGRLLLNTRRVQAGKALRQALHFGLAGIDKAYAEGQLAWILCDHEKAEACLRAVLEKRPAFPGLKEDLAALLIFMGRAGEALGFLEQAVDTERGAFLRDKAGEALEESKDAGDQVQADEHRDASGGVDSNLLGAATKLAETRPESAEAWGFGVLLLLKAANLTRQLTPSGWRSRSSPISMRPGAILRRLISTVQPSQEIRRPNSF